MADRTWSAKSASPRELKRSNVQQPAHHIGAHAPQSNHAYLHQLPPDFLRKPD
jgi:hypothetical protein